MSRQQDYEGYRWIKVKQYKDDPTKSWEERLQALEQHHIAEANFLIETVRKLAAEVDIANANSAYYQNQLAGYQREAVRQYRDQQDYVPYQDDDRDR